MILKQIADALEPRRSELKTANKTIENDFLLYGKYDECTTQ